LAYLGFGALTAVAATLGSQYNPGRSDVRSWYEGLEKPAFTPPNWVFAPVWTIIYVMIAVSGARIFLAEPPAQTKASRKAALVLWGVQMVLNGAWSPLFFGKKDTQSSLLDIGALVTSVGAYGYFARKVDPKAAMWMAPYFGWGLFAGVLNEEIWRRN
jgi:tryptophan-rich sensory protein